MTEAGEQRPGSGRPLPLEDDVALVGRFVDAQERAAQARQRAGKAADELSAVYKPLRTLDDRQREASTRLAQLSAVEEARSEWEEALQQHRDAARSAAADRVASRGRGPAARAARDRAGRSAYDMAACRERAQEAGEACRALAEQLGTMDPDQWAAMRAEAEDVLGGYPRRREEERARLAELAPAARDRVEAAVGQLEQSTEAVDQVTEQLTARGLDVDRIREAVLHRASGRDRGIPADPATEAALAGWAERQPQAGGVVEADAAGEDRRGPPDPGRDVER